MNIDKDKIKTIARKHNLELVFLFGSKTGAAQNEESDIDLAVKFERAVTRETYLDLYQDLANLFPKDNLDLVVLNDADPFLAHEVVQTGSVLFADETVLDAFSRLTYRKFYDDGQKYFPFLKQKVYA